jgi:glycine cleavage system regulatory protein
MECPVVSEPLHGGDFAPFRSKSGNKTAMHGFAVDADRACPAIAGIAAFFDTKPAEIANESSQTLSRTRFSAERLSIDLVIHYRFSSSGGKLLANLFGEVIGELFAMRW